VVDQYKDPRYKNAPPKEKPYKLSDGKGLHLLIKPNGGKYWRLKYRHATKEKTLSIGVYPETTLSEARKARGRARNLIQQGIDPSQEKQRQKATQKLEEKNSFEALTREWFEQKRGEWTAPHAKRVMIWLEKDVFPSLGHMPVRKITPQDTLMVVRKVESRGALDVAKRIRARISEIYRYAICTGRAASNPAADLIGVVKSEKVTHRPALKREALGTFLDQLDSFDRIKPITRLALRLLILTFVRPGELRGALWEEFDIERREWRIPAKRMKMKAEHIVPLSPQAIAIIEEVKTYSWHSEYLFPSDRKNSAPMSENALSYVMKRMGYQGIATPHGFRATASTILNETGFNADVIERQLAHIERNKVRAAYNRAEYLEDRRTMLEWWGNFIEATQSGADVVPIRKEA